MKTSFLLFVAVIICLIWLYKLIMSLLGFVTVKKLEYLHYLKLDNWKEGRALRQEVETARCGRISLAGFYQTISRLENERLVEGKTGTHTTHGQEFRNREYRLTPKGLIEITKITVVKSMLALGA